MLPIRRLWLVAATLVLAACRPSGAAIDSDGGLLDAQISRSEPPDSGPGTTSLDVSGDVTTHVLLNGTQVGRRTAQYIRLTLSQTNDAPLGGPTRQTFSFQTGLESLVGKPVQGTGNLQLGKDIYTGRCELTIDVEEPAGQQSRMQATFSCEQMRSSTGGSVSVSGGHFVGPVTSAK